jgi:coenzyme F420-dependent glucose-6-phosphate dehydrogenase
MVELGYKLSSEDTNPLDLVRYAIMAEEAGFSFAMASDHYHPWINMQDESPFVWSTLGGVSQSTSKLKVGTAVTCPTIRVNPVIIAQAAATTGFMMPGRFMLGLGSGENLNEHIIGDRWPPAHIRINMLEEAVKVIRMLWSGEMVNFHGKYYIVENARIYTLPDELPPIFMAADGKKSARNAGKLADGLITPGKQVDLVMEFKKSGGKEKPCYGEASVCWAETREEAIKTAYKYWPIIANKGGINWEMPTPKSFEVLAKMVDSDSPIKGIVYGDNPQNHIDHIKRFIASGYDHIFIHQLGPYQKEFIDFYRREVLPEFI